MVVYANELLIMPTFSLNKIPLGIRYMLMSAFAFALMSSCVKLVHTYGIPVFEIVAARALVSLFISYADVKRKRINIWGTNRKLLLTRGVTGSLSLICVYYAVSTLPLAEATILQYLNPVFTAVLAILFLKEKVHISTIICIVCSIMGLLLMVGPGLTLDHVQQLPLFSIGIALLGAFGSGVSYIIVKQLSRTEDSSVIILYFPLIALPLSVLLLGDDFVMPTTEAFFLLLFVGIFTQFGQVGLTKAMKVEVASKATAYSYIQVVFSIILGWLVFSEVPSAWTLAGGTMIVIGALVNVIGSLRANKVTAA